MSEALPHVPVELFETSDGLRIAYEIRGKGKPVFFIHGWASTRKFWRHQIEVISRRALVVAPDLRGHGDSDKPIPGDYRVERMALDIVELANNLSLKPFLVGHSMGCAIALIAAHRLRPRKVVLLAPPTRMPRGWELLLMEILMKVPPIAKAIIPRKTFYRPKPDLVEFVVRESAKSHPQIYREVLKQNAGLELSYPSEGTEVILLIPEHDHLASPKEFEGYIRETGAKVRIIPAAGHNATLERPELVTDFILEALELE